MNKWRNHKTITSTGKSSLEIIHQWSSGIFFIWNNNRSYLGCYKNLLNLNFYPTFSTGVWGRFGPNWLCSVYRKCPPAPAYPSFERAFSLSLCPFLFLRDVVSRWVILAIYMYIPFLATWKPFLAVDCLDQCLAFSSLHTAGTWMLVDSVASRTI